MARKKKRADGCFEVKVTVGRDPATGKAIRKSFYSSKSVAEAKRKAEAYKNALAIGEVDFEEKPAVKKSAFCHWAEEWLTTYKKPFVSDATFQSTYAGYTYNHLIPHFGHADLRDISQSDVQRFFSERADKSESFLHKCRFMLSDIFETAIENDLCEKNPVKRVKYTSTQKKNDKKALTDEQIALLTSLSAERPEVVLMLNTGIRRGELCGLQWADFDEKSKTLTINRSISESSGHCTVRPPKFNSYRTIPLNEASLNIILNQPKASLWIFPSKTGSFRRPDKWSDILQKFMHGVPEEIRCTSHELRHTYGSYLRRHGIDIFTIQKILGHKDINVTAGIYVHEDIDSMRNELEQIQLNFVVNMS